MYHRRFPPREYHDQSLWFSAVFNLVFELQVQIAYCISFNCPSPPWRSKVLFPFYRWHCGCPESWTSPSLSAIKFQHWGSNSGLPGLFHYGVGDHSHNSRKKGMMPPSPLQLPEGKKEYSLVTSPFSTFRPFPGDSVSGVEGGAGGWGWWDRLGHYGEKALWRRGRVADGKRDNKLFLDGIFQTGPQSENKCAFWIFTLIVIDL